MKKSALILCSILFLNSCKQEKKSILNANDIVNKAIEVAGGDRYKMSKICFKFRDKEYVSEDDGKILKRIFYSDSINYIDIKNENSFKRFVNDTPVITSDSLSKVYSNSINSVNYFAQLPYRLNDAAVRKELLKEETIENIVYYVVKVTFDKNGGGDDFEDTYLYWFHKESFKLDYLAYDFHTNGGGVRFRKAYNERFVNGIRFLDYENYKPYNENATLKDVSKLYKKGKLKKVSKIELENIEVTINY